MIFGVLRGDRRTTVVGVEAFDLMRKVGATIPWMQANLWKRGAKRERAWVLGIREAIVVERQDQYQDATFYYEIGRAHV